MPVQRIGTPNGLDHVVVLDEEGGFDAELDPGLDPESLLRLYRCMMLVRAFDERKLRLQRQGRIGTFAPATGQEAAQLGSIFEIGPDDWFVPSFRETAAAVWRGMALEDDLAYCAGLEEGIKIAPEAHDLPLCIPVASQLPHAVGLAWALRLQGSDRVVLAYLGDGATSEGDFHEALNLAGLRQLPVVFFCQNNQWAISVPREMQTASATLAQKAYAYGLRAVSVDGNDLFGVARVTREAVEAARRGDGPTLIEAITYRLGVHTTADDPTKYRTEEEVERWRRRDPLPRLRNHLLRVGILTPELVEQVEAESIQRVQEAVEAFERLPTPDPAGMFDHAFAELPTSLRTQQAELARVPQTTEEAETTGEAPTRSSKRQPEHPEAPVKGRRGRKTGRKPATSRRAQARNRS